MCQWFPDTRPRSLDWVRTVPVSSYRADVCRYLRTVHDDDDDVVWSSVHDGDDDVVWSSCACASQEALGTRCEGFGPRDLTAVVTRAGVEVWSRCQSTGVALPESLERCGVVV